MKKLIALFVLIGLTLTAPAQLVTVNTNAIGTTNSMISGPVADAFNFVTREGITNWWICPFATYSETGKDFGGGLAIGYNLSQFVAPVLRIDYLRGSCYSMQGDLQLQVPVKLFGKVEVVPFGFAGAATALSDAGGHEGELIGVFGVGAAVRLSKHFDVAFDWEMWSGGQFDADHQWRFGLLYKF